METIFFCQIVWPWQKIIRHINRRVCNKFLTNKKKRIRESESSERERTYSLAASDLFHHNINGIAIFHVELQKVIKVRYIIQLAFL